MRNSDEILAHLGSASGTAVAQVVHTYRGHRPLPDGSTVELTVDLLRGPEGFTVEAHTANGLRASPGTPTPDIAAAIASTDWAALDR